jgi:phosphatidylglycerol:prolipoprotein diacylglycerol transferase
MRRIEHTSDRLSPRVVKHQRNMALDISMVLMIAGFVGARLFHIIFEEPSYYGEDPWRIFEIWKGGFVWYGGAILGGLSAVTFLRLKREPMAPWLDLFAPICALGYALGRVACWMTGCCFGDICELPSGFRFRHPTQLYAIVWELAALAILLALEKRKPELRRRRPGRLFAVWILLHCLGRIFMEVFRADPRGPEPLGISIATWLSLTLITITLACFKTRRV